MTFIRVTRKENGNKVDVNSSHVISFEAISEGGTLLYAQDGVTYKVNESARQIRAFIKKAQGLFDERTVMHVDIEQQPLNSFDLGEVLRNKAKSFLG